MSAAFTTLKLHQKGGENLKTQKETGTTQEKIYCKGYWERGTHYQIN